MIFIFAVSVVSGQDSISTCISICTEYTSAECNAKCDEPCVPSDITNVPECELGTCFDNNKGTCMQNSPKKLCEDGEGTWDKDPNNANCKKGCCIMSGNAFLSTARQCANMAEAFGITKTFRPEANSALKCLTYMYSLEEGACITGVDSLTGKNNCQFISKARCLELKGQFYGGFLCSYPELETKCTKEKTSKCVEGKDELYWFDSCGNRENIYDANKVKSWNEGKVLSNNESCVLKSGSNPVANQGTCGNCNYIMGSRCGNKTANEKLDDSTQKSVCRDLSCIDENGNRRVHGETWCAYQGAIGVAGNNQRAVDTPGSSHFRKICYEGDVRTEPCADARSEICIENKTEGKSSASCVINEWAKCLSANSKSENARVKECKKYPAFCFMKQINVDDHFKFGMCAPKYPPGHNLTSGEGSSCKLGTMTCEVTYVKDYNGHWNCEDNCDCRHSGFASQMNDLCMSLGDCGAEVNYEGILTKNYKVSRTSALQDSYINGLMKYANVTPGKFATGEGILGNYSGDWEMNSAQGSEFFMNLWDSSWWGGGALLLTMINPIAFMVFGAELIADFAVTVLGISEDNFFVEVALYTNPFRWFGVGDSKQKDIIFTCKPWEAPAGGKYCDRCGKDGFTCTDYACSSLGQTCVLVNRDTGSERCVDSAPTDVSVPIISPWESALSEGFNYTNANALGVNIVGESSDGCIPSFTIFDMGITTDKVSQCKYSTKAGFEFEQEGEEIPLDTYNTDAEFFKENLLEGYFGTNIYNESHSMKFIVPTLESLGKSSLGPNPRADYNLYVKCKGANGVINEADYAIGFCIKPGVDFKPPEVAHTIPDERFVKADAKSESMLIYIDEPAECRWSLPDVKYELMKNNFTCRTDIDEQTIFGWGCNATLPLEEGNKSTFYVQCMDQPWEETLSKRNVMPESYKIELARSKPLEIISIKPDGETLIFGVEPAAVKIEVEIDGGVEGTAACYYSLDNENYHLFSKSEGLHQEQVFNSLLSGSYPLQVRCSDSVNNSAERDISFTVDIDAQPPKIARVYQAQGDLIIKTSEEAECAISMEKCDFNYENATLMSGTEYYHSTPITIKSIYYIMCKDKFGNYGGSCDLKIKTI